MSLIRTLIPTARSVVIVMLVIFIAQVIIGKKEINLGFAIIPVLPMLFAVMIGMFISSSFMLSKIKVWGKCFSKEEESFCSKMVGYCLLILGTQYAGMIVPNLEMIVKIGVPLLLQEIGNLLPVLVAVPL
ncbi:DUF3100 domain-containing protein [Citrobacter braakii]|uniref:DUF3100 domain-containing protein n=1 Tax=Citrobacter braakii TaxID=57706 RepID=UPI0039749B02